MSDESGSKEQLQREVEQLRQRVTELEALEEERKQTEDILRDGLNRLKESLLGPGSLPEKMKRITDGVVDIQGADFARIWLMKPGDRCDSGCTHAELTEGPRVCRDRKRCLHLVASSGRYTHTDGTHGRIPFGSCKIGRVAAAEERGFLTNDVTHDPLIHDRDWARELGLKSFFGYRLVSREGAPIGVIALFSKQTLSPGDGALLETIASAVSEIVQVGESLEALRKSEERHRRFADNMPDMVYEICLDGSVIYANRAASDRLGISLDKLGTITIVDLLDGESLERAVLDMQRIFESKERLSDMQYNLRTVAGEIVPVETHAILLEVEGEQPTVLGIARDITERKQAEEETAALLEQLQQSQKMEAIGRLAGGVAHDINNMLSGIIGYATLAQMDLEPGDPRSEDTGEILTICKSARELTGNLLGFARKDKYLKEYFDLNDSVRRVREILKHSISKKIEIETQLAENLPGVEGDSSQLDQVLMNLCINAADAMEDGGTLTIRTREFILDETGRSGIWDLEAGKYVELSVVDDGAGMAQDILDRVFEPFFTTRPKGQGTGLGLSMVYGTVKNHGGTVSLGSEPGRGTTVVVLLPALGPDSDLATQESGKQEAPTMGEGTILLVDDEDMVRRSTARVLERIGYRVLQAGDGKEALEIFRERSDDIALVLLDMAMPVMSGPETFIQFKKLNPAVRVLFFSGFSADDMASSLMAEGAVGFIQKPFLLDKLADEVAKALAT